MRKSATFPITLFSLLASCHLLSATETNKPEGSPKTERIYISGDWLYWQANETGLSYAINNDDLDISDDTVMGTGSAINPKFDWHSGFRAGIGYVMPHDNWDLSLSWTWYEDQAVNSVTSEEEDRPTILPTFIHPNIYNSQAIAGVFSASADLFLHLNVLDLSLGKTCNLGKSFSLKPHMGIRTAWLNQNYNIQYDQLFDKTADLVLEEYSTSIKNDFWGIGILGGLGSDWKIKGGLSLFGDLSVSLLYGFFDTSYSEAFITRSGAGGLTISDTNSFRAGRAITDLQLGLKWASNTFKKHFKILLQGAWEHHMYFSQNQIMRFTDGQSWGSFVQNQGDVDFQGWTASAKLLF